MKKFFVACAFVAIATNSVAYDRVVCTTTKAGADNSIGFANLNLLMDDGLPLYERLELRALSYTDFRNGDDVTRIATFGQGTCVAKGHQGGHRFNDIRCSFAHCEEDRAMDEANSLSFDAVRVRSRTQVRSVGRDGARSVTIPLGCGYCNLIRFAPDPEPTAEPIPIPTPGPKLACMNGTCRE